tara:strand:+ start:112 stop:972 length:861 start_codon:yes stop_codon:yes gene_type:complete
MINRIIVGTMTWGKWGKNLSINEMSDKIKFCFDHALNTFDHADIYGGYTTESEFGKAFKLSGINRKDLFFISKCGIQYPCDSNNLTVKHYNYSKQHIINSVNNSLSNLNTGYLDLLLLHRPSPLMHTDIISDAVDELIKQGKIKDFGVSNFKPSHIELLSKNINISWNQIEFSISNSSPMLDGTIDFHQINDIGTMAWSPLGNFFKIESPENRRIKKIFKKLNEKYDTNSENLLLAWILKHPSRIYPIIGTTTNDRVKGACDSLKINLDIEDWFSIFEAQKGERIP